MSSKKVTGKTVKTVKGDQQATDIQNYLETFNKEIEGGDNNQTVGIKFETSDAQDPLSSEGENEGSYYIDQSTGQYYYETRNAAGQRIMTAVPGLPEDREVIGEVDENEEEEVITSEVPASAGSNEMVLNNNDGDANFQTVTIVPSETSTGEVSYVLIVQQPDDKEKEDTDQDLTVYDFDDHEEQQRVVESADEEEVKTKIMKVIPKKPQQVTQAHMCNYCNYTTPKRYLLYRHMKSHSEERPHKCSVCERGFKTLPSLQNHVNTHTGTKPHPCKYCQSAFTTSGELVRHVRYKHTHEKPHKCSVCDYASVELSKMRNHMRCHTGERPYQCPHCTYASPDTFKLKRHLRIHTGEKPYECDICTSRFTQSNSLKAHKLIHTGDKPVYQCELCPATCGRKTDLRIHVQKLHTSDKPLKCKRCGKQFPDRYSYKMHSKSHEGEKCWKCDLCPYASASQRHLESHLLIHTDEKPFQCDQCDQAFRQKQLLRRHQNLYHNPDYVPPPPREKTHECPECPRAFRHRGNLMRHMSAHDPESSAAEKAEALKIGRKKKIIDGEQMEVIRGRDYEEIEADMQGNVVAVEGTDGQQYVVLEVIQLQDGEHEDEEGQMSVLNSGGISDAVKMLREDQEDEEMLSEDEDKKPIKSDMDNCFGFDDEEEDEKEEDESDEDEDEAVITSKPRSVIAIRGRPTKTV